jgi:hypothetical protein
MALLIGAENVGVFVFWFFVHFTLREYVRAFMQKKDPYTKPNTSAVHGGCSQFAVRRLQVAASTATREWGPIVLLPVASPSAPAPRAVVIVVVIVV